MAITSLPEIDIKKLLKALESKTNINLPERVISITLNEDVLHIRFKHPKKQETDVETLPLKTPIYLFRDEKIGEITALEILDIDQALAELGQPMKTVKRNSSIAQSHWSAEHVTYEPIMMLQKYTGHEGIDDIVEREYTISESMLREYQIELLVKPLVHLR